MRRRDAHHQPRTLLPCLHSPGKILKVRLVVGSTPLAFRDTLHLLADGQIGPARSPATEPAVAAG